MSGNVQSVKVQVTEQEVFTLTGYFYFYKPNGGGGSKRTTFNIVMATIPK